MRALVLMLVLAACGGSTISGTACADDKDCNLFNAQGRCESTGWCSFPDETCIGGQRYSPGAGDNLAGTCVGDNICGGRDQACCGAGVCADHLTCATEVGTCQCGEVGQPCCDGTTCGAGSHCGAGAVCGTSDVLQAAVGAGHACALFADHTVSCWGYDYKPYPYQPGLGDAVIASATPFAISGATDVAEIRAAEMHTCARKTDNTLWCWGHNENGQLGNGTKIHSKAAVQVPGLTNVSLFDGGRVHMCALASYNGTAGLWCWGRGGENNMRLPGAALGKLGNNSAADSSVPVRVDLSVAGAAGQTVKSLSTGSYHSCIAMSDNKVWCWGRNSSGELGDGTTNPSKVPVQVNLAGITLPPSVSIDEVSCSDGRRKQNSTCIRLSNGTVYCWGANGHGELGDGGTTARSAPTLAVDTLALGNAKIVQLVAASFAKCARTDDGNVWCWGENKNGIVGINDAVTANHPTPRKTTVLLGVTQLDMSHKLACAVDSTKHLYCWGTNRRGQAKARRPLDKADSVVLEPTQVVF